MNLKDLKKELPYKWRVQSFSKYKAFAQCVSYIDARDVMNLLDEVVGAENWKDDFKIIDNKLFCGISIKFNNEWVTKWDTGNESNIEKNKGQVSDSFKRSAVKWGVGRFLYNLKIKHVITNGAKTDKNKFPYVVDNNGKRVWDLTEFINNTNIKKLVKINKPQLTKIQDLINFTKKDLVKILNVYKVENLKELTFENANKLINQLIIISKTIKPVEIKKPQIQDILDGEIIDDETKQAVQDLING